MLCRIVIDVHTRYCHLPLSWKSLNWFECAMDGLLICFGVVDDVSAVSMAN
jgi:hypothetical protein